MKASKNPHPFAEGLEGMEDTAYKVKIVSTAMGSSATEAVRQMVDKIISEMDPAELSAAMKKIGPPKRLLRLQKEHMPPMSEWIDPPWF